MYVDRLRRRRSRTLSSAPPRLRARKRSAKTIAVRPRFTQEKLRVAEALEGLPELDRALRDGELNWSAVRELTRVATLTTEQSWISAARGRTVRDVEKLVSGRKPGDRPTTPRRQRPNGTRFASTSARRFWRLFVTRWPNCDAIPADRSTTTRLCSSWHAKCWAGCRFGSVELPGFGNGLRALPASVPERRR